MTKKESKENKNNSMWWISGAVLVLAVLALIIMTRPESDPDAQVPVPPEEPQLEPEPVLPTPEEPEVTVPEEPSLAQENAEVVTLLDKMSGIKSLTFIATTYTVSRGDLRQVDIGTYSVFGDAAKVKPINLISMDGWSADYVFLDLATEKAWGYCLEITSCRNLQKQDETAYAPFRITMPQDWADIVKYGELTSTRMYNNRRVHVVEWEADGLYWEALLDEYYGIPVKVIATSDAEGANIVKGSEYRSMTFNNVKASDVERPY